MFENPDDLLADPIVPATSGAQTPRPVRFAPGTDPFAAPPNSGPAPLTNAAPLPTVAPPLGSPVSTVAPELAGPPEAATLVSSTGGPQSGRNLDRAFAGIALALLAATLVVLGISFFSDGDDADDSAFADEIVVAANPLVSNLAAAGAAAPLQDLLTPRPTAAFDPLAGVDPSIGGQAESAFETGSLIDADSSGATADPAPTNVPVDAAPAAESTTASATTAAPSTADANTGDSTNQTSSDATDGESATNTSSDAEDAGSNGETTTASGGDTSGDDSSSDDSSSDDSATSATDGDDSTADDSSTDSTDAGDASDSADSSGDDSDSDDSDSDDSDSDDSDSDDSDSDDSDSSESGNDDSGVDTGNTTETAADVVDDDDGQTGSTNNFGFSIGQLPETTSVTSDDSSDVTSDGQTSTSLVAGPSADEIAAAKSTALAFINDLRSSAGAAPVSFDATLNARSQQWSDTMAATQNFVHCPFDNGTPKNCPQAPLSAACVNQAWAENIGYGTFHDLVLSELAQSAGHYRNMVDTRHSQVGIGVTYAHGSWWVTHTFGTCG